MLRMCSFSLSMHKSACRLMMCLFLLVPTFVYSNQFFFDVQRFSMKDGLPDSTVFSIASDNQGYIWLGTPNGLSRFNGKTFDNFSAANPRGTEIATRNNSNIFIDSKQRVWVGTWGQGVFVYDQELRLLHHFSSQGEAKNYIASDLVQVFFEDSDGDVWIGTNGGGVALFSDEQTGLRYFTHAPLDNSTLSHNRIWHLAEGEHGAIWVATGKGLDLINKEDAFSIHRFNLHAKRSDPLNEQRVRRLLIDDSGNFWVGTENGVCQMNQERNACNLIQKFGVKNNIDARITSLVVADSGKLWIGTLSGLYLFDPQSKEFIPLASGGRLALLPHDDIRDISIDENGALWIASRPSGLIKITIVGDAIAGFTEFYDGSGKVDDIGRVQALLVDRAANLWVGSTQGLLRMGAGEDRPRFVTDEMGVVVSMIEDSDGTLWFGSNKGMFQKTPNSSAFDDLNSAFPTNNQYVIESLFQDSYGTMWVGTFHQGLFRYDDNKFIAVTYDDVIPQMRNSGISSITEDRHQFVVVGLLGHGLFRFRLDSEKTQAYQSGSEGGLSDNNIVDTLKDKENVLWVATGSSLNQLNDISNTFSYFPQDNSLKNLAIKKLLADNENNIWFSTANGVYRLNVSRTGIVHYTTKDGLHADEFVTKAGVAADSGEIYFGGSRGFSRIRTTSLNKEKIKPKTAINQVAIDDNRLFFISNETEKKYELAHSVKDISFEFTDLNLLTNYNSEFSYRLLGHKDAWSPPSTSSDANFSGLSHGDYEFQVVSVINDTRGENVAIFSFTIMPPWWQTWAARISYLIMFCLGLWAWSRWRLRNWRARNTLLKQEVELRSNELVDAQTQLIESEKNASITSLVVGVAHEINTPVGIGVTASTCIHDDANNLLNKFRKNEITKSEFEKRLTNICDSATLITTNLDKANNLIHSFKNLSTDQISQTKRDINLGDYLNQVLINLAPTLQRSSVKWQLNCADDIVICTYPGAIAQLITQLALNAIEHAFDGIAHPAIEIDVTEQDKNVVFEFKDNGVGISDEMKEQIFKPFFTTKRISGSVGLGLQVVSNIVTIRLGGNVQVSDNKPHGAIFRCEFSFAK